ncbi:MAG: sigma-70 family RNA polymerase sigma factor [Ignavibacteria bacterium]|nr:sigma-70 family RNA polymerase sigma factor [Ignavibacteria bacterium]
MVERPDEEIIEECLRGNLGAFEELVQKYEKVMYNTALRMVRDPEDAADITQNAFLKVFERLGRYDRQHKFFSWLYRIVVNESLNFLKARKVTIPHDETIPSTTLQPDAKFHQTETTQVVEEALLDLPVEQRIVLILRHFHNLSYREISNVVEVSEKKVKSRLFAGRQGLRKLLTQRGLFQI